MLPLSGGRTTTLSAAHASRPIRPSSPTSTDPIVPFDRPDVAGFSRLEIAFLRRVTHLQAVSCLLTGTVYSLRICRATHAVGNRCDALLYRSTRLDRDALSGYARVPIGLL